MCGIWGFVTAETQRGAHGRLRFVENAAVAGTLRGDDSTGAFIVPHKGGAADWCKVVGTGMDWLTSSYTQERFIGGKMANYRAVVGHNRSATLGKVTLDNAHPFQEGAITLVHNGTLDFMDDMKVQADDVKGGKGKKVEVDSHLICHNLAQHPVEEVIPTLYGAFALVWHDSRTDSVYMIRNSQRPLHLMKAKCENTVLFASEPDMLWWLAGRTNFARGDVYSLDSGVLLEFKAGETKPEARRITLSYKSKYSSYSYYYGDSSQKSAASASSASSGKDESSGATNSSAPTGGTSKRGKDMLTLLGLNARQELEFSVESVIKSRGTTAIVNGWAYYQNDHGKTEAMQAVLHGVDEKFARDRSRDDWHVRPVAVWKIGEAAKSQPCLVCRLVRVSPAYSKQSSTNRRCIGPSGDMIPINNFLDLTRMGCVECSRTLSVLDAPHIMWVNNKTQPMCAECADRWTFPDENITLAVN